MRGWIVAGVLAAVVALGACGGGGDDRAGTATMAPVVTGEVRTTPSTTAAEPQRIDVPIPAGLRGAERQAFVTGRTVAAETGCLACHRIGTGGGSLGSNLNGVGRRLSAKALRRVLVNPEPPMPAYRELSAAKLDALVSFLAALRDRSCPDASDCG